MREKGTLLMLVLCLGWVCADSAPAAGQGGPATAANVEEALARLEERMSAVQTLKARFVQQKHLAVLEQPLVLEGEIYMQKPALFAWHVREPLRYSMVVRDEVVRQWDEDTQRVETISLSRNPAFKLAIRQMRGWFSGAYRSMLAEYEVTVLSEAPISLQFVPREGGFARAAVENVTVVFEADERYIRELHVAEKGGDSTVLTFVDTQLNGPIDASAWKVEPRAR
jgi:outer membrane lipoprotein-sorting protein